jgi:ABC-type transport system involved in cytochrome bd biosynthesis fused ATPase/permease subunit
MSKDALEPGCEEAVRRAAGTISAERYRLPDVDLELAPGRPAAPAGPSGPGKSAIVLALLRFTDLDAGELTVNGADARGLPGAAQRPAGLESRTAVLFPASLRANLRFGRRTSRTGRSSAFPHTSGLGPWLDQLGDGLDTVLAPGTIRSPAQRCSGSARPGPC